MFGVEELWGELFGIESLAILTGKVVIFLVTDVETKIGWEAIFCASLHTFRFDKYVLHGEHV